MTNIGEIFVKDIDRQMNPVIMASDQHDEKVIFQELDEYVVTKEIDENLEKFYKAFNEGMKSGTSNIGAWISGDFGSGKSHFLKILSYLLNNREVTGKKASEYFKDKVSPQVLTLMQTTGRKKIDTILFDIDSESREGQNSENLVQIYLLVFNRMCGLSTAPAVAEMERHLISEGFYERFKNEFEKISGKTWNSQRTKPIFIKSKIKDALIASGAYANPEEAAAVSENATQKHEISSKEFANMIAEHCKQKGDDYALVFLVDEVGQFISKKSQLMLRLQTITEDLGVACRGKVWNLVTSQEDIDMISSYVNNDEFSKIQGRFPTRVKMSTTDVKEVIEKRVLLKKPEYEESLKAYFEGERESIQNKLQFENQMQIQIYKNKEEFFRTYPFVSYQYSMLQTMLTQLRDKSRAGKNISNAARSMLKTFKDTVVAYKGGDLSTVIPMYAFYDSLTTELDTPTLNVFGNARKNDLIEDFDINVLKTLFLVKYFDGLSTTITNITAMMVSSFNQNRIELKKQVEESLGRLVSQNFVQRNGETYMFLTNDEQEINREIKRETVDREKRLQMISRIAFGEILNLGGKFKYDNTHQYSINKIVDTENPDGTSHELSFKISTPARKVDPATLSLESIDSVVFELSSDERLLQAIDEYLATESYVRKSNGTEMPNSKKIILDGKESQLKEMRARATELLRSALQSAAVFINQSSSNLPEYDPGKRAEKALCELIEARYHKMSYIKNSKKREQIEQLFKNRTLLTFNEAVGDDKLAVNEILVYLEEQTALNATIKMSNVMEKFKRIPYGFGDDDIAWIMGLLFRHNKIGLVFEGVQYDGKKVDVACAMDLLIKPKNYDKIEVKIRESVSPESIDRAASIFGLMLSKSLQSDEASLVSNINDGSNTIYNELNGYLEVIRENPKYPWKKEIEELKEFIGITKERSSPEIFKFIDKNESDLSEVRGKLDKYREFFAVDSSRKKLFDKGIACIESFEANKAYLSNNVADVAKNIEAIITSDDLKGLPELNNLCSEYHVLLNKLIQCSVPRYKDNVDDIYNQYCQEFTEHGDLMIELQNYRDEAKNGIEGVSKIGDLEDIVKGFGFKAHNLKSKIPKPEPIPEPDGKSPAPLPREEIGIRKLIPKISIDSESDIDVVLETMEKRMREKLRDGPFDIRM